MVDPAIALPASRPERAPAIGLRFVTALGFTRSGSNNRLPLPAAAGGFPVWRRSLRRCHHIDIVRGETTQRRKRRDVIELVKSSAAMQTRHSTRRRNERYKRFMGVVAEHTVR